MLDSGYEGVREVAKRLNFTLGWSATSGAVDNFVYEEANETFINDPEMRKRLLAKVEQEYVHGGVAQLLRCFDFRLGGKTFLALRTVLALWRIL